MVVLTVITNSNNHTVYFKEPLEKYEYIRLIGCSLYNSWYNLKRSGEISIFDTQGNASVYRIPDGNYSLSAIASILNDTVFNSEGVKVETNSPQGGLEIFNPQNKKIQLDDDLASLLGIKKRLQPINYVKRFTTFNNYFIHCDLLDKYENLFNGNPSIMLRLP